MNQRKKATTKHNTIGNLHQQKFVQALFEKGLSTFDHKKNTNAIDTKLSLSLHNNCIAYSSAFSFVFSSYTGKNNTCKVLHLLSITFFKMLRITMTSLLQFTNHINSNNNKTIMASQGFHNSCLLDDYIKVKMDNLM